MGSVGTNVPHDSARGHVTGESQFIDDIPPQHGELFVEVAGSPVAHGRIRAVGVGAARGGAGGGGGGAGRLAVKMQVEELPAILSIDDAIEKGSFLGVKRTIETGDV